MKHTNCQDPAHNGCPKCLYTYCPTCERYFDEYGKQVSPEDTDDIPSEECQDCFINENLESFEV
jgi:Zn-finger protein